MKKNKNKKIKLPKILKKDKPAKEKPKKTKIKKNKDKKKRISIKKILSYIGLTILGGGILIMIAAASFLGYIVINAPSFDPDNLYRKEATIIYDDDGKIMTKIGREIRDKISYNDIPEVFVDALVATEDSRFFQHNGFDFPRFLKASFGQLLGKSGAGGASTITMQVVKNNFTSTKQTIARKFTDIYLAVFKLEKKYTKEEILEFYVNAPYLGNGSYGIAEAARNYFGKDLKDINLSEAALLAGLFQAPGAYDPYIYPERAEERRKTVLYLMHRHGYISKEEEEIANSIPVKSLLVDKSKRENDIYQGYIDVVIDEVTEKTGYNPYNVPMRIYTNYNEEKQQYLNKVLTGELFKFPNDVIQLGVAVTDINTGAILAIGNGRNRTGERLYNYATMLKRQIGSTAKPLFDYGPGMEFNNWSTYTPFLDDRYAYSNGTTINNWDGKYNGVMTLRNALAQSRNIPALRAFQQVDNKKIIEFVKSLGITPEIEGGRIHEAHAIGAFNGASPLQLAAAYGAFGNGGYYIEPYTVNKIEYIDNNGTQLFKSKKTRVMSDSTAYLITNVLNYAVDNHYIGGGRVSGVEVAAKTGTSNFDEETKRKYNLPSNALNDLWYAGFSPDYAIGMWFGYEKIDPKYYNTTSSWSIRDRLFTTLAKGLFDKNGHKFTMPKSVVKVAIEKGTAPAMLPSKYTPSNMITTEYFKKGTEPTEVSPRYNTLPNPTNVDITTADSKIKITWNSAKITSTITTELIDLFAEHQDKYIQRREQEDLNYLGTLGYNVYLKNTDGSLTLLGWTDKNSYTHTPSAAGTLTYVIKTCYSKFKNNQSSGSEITISDNPYTPIIDVSLNGAETITLSVGDTYEESGIIILEDGAPVTSGYTVTKTTTKSPDDILIEDNIIDTSEPTTYTINYTVTYKEQTYTTAPRTIIIE